MNRRTSGYRSDSELLSHTAEDLSLLLQGDVSSSAGGGGSFLEAKNLFDHGTEQLRQLLLRECILIYECSRCRNMFRELSSFITHKRVYCGTYAIRRGCNNRNGSQEQLKASSGSSNFNELLWRWLKATGGNVKPPDTQGYCRSSNSAATAKHSAITPCHDLHNKVGNAAHGTARRRNATQTASIIVDDTSAALSLNCNNHRFICNVCKLSFPTNRSLKLHRHKKHVASRYAFQCPNCVLNFQQPAAVVRHLSKVHNKSIGCIKQMRNVIHKRRIYGEAAYTKHQPNARKSNTNHSCALSTTPTVIKTNAFLMQEKSCTINDRNNVELAVTKTHHKAENTLPCQPYNSTTVTQIEKVPPLDVAVIEAIADSSLVLHHPAPSQADKEFCNEVKSTNSTLSTKRTREKLKSKYLPCLCKICNKHFSALSNLRRHISMFHYRTRKFGCNLCDYRAYRKYDVHNHLAHVHKIEGDKESTHAQYITVNEESNARDDVDDDVVLIDEDKRPLDVQDEKEEKKEEAEEKKIQELKPKLALGAHKRRINEPPLLLVSTPIKSTREKLKRSQKALSTKCDNLQSQQQQQKRPKRKRITPVKKDFVYDLANILKKEQSQLATVAPDVPTRALKRRNTIVLSSQLANLNLTAKPAAVKVVVVAPFKPLHSYAKELLVHAAKKTALAAVQQGCAALASLPQLPTERPKVRMRHASFYRTDLSAVPVIETTALDEARSKAKLLDDSFFKNLTTNASIDKFRMRPRLSLPQSTITSLLKKVDLTLQQNIKIKSEISEAEDSGAHDLDYSGSTVAADTDTEVFVKQEFPLYMASTTTTQPDFSANNGAQNQHHHHHHHHQQHQHQLIECLVEPSSLSRDSLLRLALEH